ncbi:MAG: DUF916 domain-containing protein [Flavobacteriales bacterium]|nr:DUF916 domain-containing protein [Flavobacteriales bacterium]MCB9362998.1 DUF916 domain-containing protein [Flavobacteriales bacterium]
MIRKYFIILYLVSLSTLLFAQTDTSNVDTPSPTVERGNDDYKTRGISVSPAHFHLNMKPGEVKTYKITIKNDTEKAEKFKVNTFDFNMNGKGKSNFIPPGTGKYSLSKWLNVSPTFIEIAPGEKKEVKFTVNIPTDSTGNKAAWNIIMIEQEEPRKKIRTS